MLKPDLTIEWAVQVFKAIGYDANEIAELFNKPVEHIQPAWDDSGWHLTLQASNGKNIVFEGDVVVHLDVAGAGSGR